MRPTSWLSRAAFGGGSPNVAKDLWLKTKTPGIYVRPEETEGQVWVFSDKSSYKRIAAQQKVLWNSRRNLEQLPEVDLQGRKGVVLPGLRIIPEEIENRDSKIMQVLWERENEPGISFSFRPSKPKEANVLELHVFIHRSRDAELIIDTTTQTVRYKSKTAASSKWERMCFSNDSIIQCYPFKKGRALHFVNCGLYTRLHGLSPKERVEYKTVYVHLPESAGLVHEEYLADKEIPLDGEGKMYGRYYAERAERNEEVFEEFLNKLRSIVGEDKVVMCESADDAVLNINDTRSRR